MSTTQQGKKKKKYNWAPYLLILPSLVYLAVFFAWPMVRGLTLAVWNDEANLTLQAEASQDSDVAGKLPQGTAVTILDQQGNQVPVDEIDESNLQKEIWYQVVGIGTDGAPISGVCGQTHGRIRVGDFFIIHWSNPVLSTYGRCQQRPLNRRISK